MTQRLLMATLSLTPQIWGPQPQGPAKVVEALDWWGGGDWGWANKLNSKPRVKTLCHQPPTPSREQAVYWGPLELHVPPGTPGTCWLGRGSLERCHFYFRWQHLGKHSHGASLQELLVLGIRLALHHNGGTRLVGYSVLVVSRQK